MARFGFAPLVTAVASKPMVAFVSDGAVYPEVCLLHIASTTAPDDHVFDFALADISDIGTGGTSLTIETIGPGASSSCTAKQATWSSADPTIRASTSYKLGLGLYRRGKAQFQFPMGEGIRPQRQAASAGLEIYCHAVGSASVAFRHTVNWYE